jgi:periplasmic divalent cation tolerance protein
MVYVTAPDRAVARKLARLVVRERLAACANLAPIESLYWWKGKLQESDEVLVIFKTRRALAKALMTAVKAAHPYEVPCIVAYPMIDALPAYAQWIDEETIQR